MRVTHGRFAREYVYDLRLGKRQVKRLMRGGVQLWPTAEERVGTVALDLTLPDGTLDGAYWEHALELVGLASSEVCHVRVLAGGREYNLQSTYGVWNRCVLRHGVLDFGDKGPLVQALRVGDDVVMEAVVPLHEGVHVAAGENASADGDTGLPWLPGTGLRVVVYKGRKRESAGCRFEVVGLPSGVVHVAGYGQKNGHCRGRYEAMVYAAGMGCINGVVERWDDGFAEGDVGVKVRGGWYYAGSGELVPVFPAFKRRWVFKVTGLTVRDFTV